MKLLRIQVKGLFGKFDYDIPLDNPERLTIITGPNGFGKTMILNFVYALASNDYDFALDLDFESIELLFEGEVSLAVMKKADQVHRVLRRKGEVEIQGILASVGKGYENASFNLSSISYLKDQRLLQIDQQQVKINGHTIETKEVGPRILKAAQALKAEMEEAISVSGRIANHLDASYLKRAMAAVVTAHLDELKSQYQAHLALVQELKALGFPITQPELPEINPQSANLVQTYLEDAKQRLAPYNHLLAKLKLFTEIINQRRLYFKQMRINPEHGFEFITDEGQLLPAAALSSGEQNQVVLWYELIVSANENAILLIDEPETGLHVAWQREYLDDLLKVLEFKNSQAIVATHSPAIINDRWDLVYNLEHIREN